MAHCTCLNGHDMWNGDGKPIVDAYRVDYILSYSMRHPECVLGLHSGFQLYDCFYDDPKEEPDCWYCDECQSLTIFIDAEHVRYDFEKMDKSIAVNKADVADWDKYYALRDKEFVEEFMDFYKGMTPAEAITKYAFQYEYRVSPDRKLICAFDKDGVFCFGFTQKRCIHFKN